MGARVKAETVGIFVDANEYLPDAERMLRQAQEVLPVGIELEYDGRYVTMFCDKAKNYALYDGAKVIIRGSVMRSRGVEPFLRSLTQKLIRFLLGASEENPVTLALEIEAEIEKGDFPVKSLAKSEILSQNPEAYVKNISSGVRPSLASAEVAVELGGQVPKDQLPLDERPE